jgi:CRISPR system Cascade subunit CasA
MNPTFNLVDEDWIPCITVGGATVERSIREVLTNALNYQEVYDNSPLVTVALHRLLLAILYRACGPNTNREARALLTGGIPNQQVNDYLDRWHDRFYLFSEEHPFFQTAGLQLRNDQTSPLTRLANEVRFAGMFDHSTDPESPAYSPPKAARLLVAAQSYAVGFGKSSHASINGTNIDPPYSSDAILLRGLTAWLTGPDFQHTLLMNLCPSTRPPDDLPSWELDEPHSLRDTKIKGQAQRRSHSARGVVDRYTWQSRLLRLLPQTTTEHRIVVRDVCFTQGRDADKSPGDPMKAYKRDEKKGYLPLALSATRASWRDIHALLINQSDLFMCPPVISSAAEIIDSSATCVIHVVGMATAPNKAAKFLLWRHDRIPTPAALLCSASLAERLAEMLEHAEHQSTVLYQRARRLCATFLSAGERKADPIDVKQLADDIDPTRDYWANLEAHFYKLLRQLPHNRDQASEDWKQAVWREASSAFDRAAEQLGQSARALRARALVPGFGLYKKSPHSETAKEVNP